MTYDYNEWLKNGCPKIFCKCGCGREIIIKPLSHKYYDIPEYIYGHNRKGKHPSEESKQKMRGENNPNFGKSTWIKGKHISKECKLKMQKASLGENNPNWQGGISFLPYCEKFNEKRKEEVREEYNRKCYICGKLESEQMKNQEQRGKRLFRLSVHHVDEDKEQGCNDKPWKLVPLCLHCHNSRKIKVLNNLEKI